MILYLQFTEAKKNEEVSNKPGTSGMIFERGNTNYHFMRKEFLKFKTFYKF